jgi:glycerophosphoryl diester phosphodiesterase
MKHDVLVIAHRGASDLLPDNTIESFDRALVEKADMLELDVRKTSDGQLVLYHDWYMKPVDNSYRNQGFSKPASHASYSQLYDCCLNDGFQLAILEDVLARYGGKISINIELKAGGYEKEVVDLVHKYDLAGSVVLSSFFPWVIMKLKDIDSEIKTGWIVGQEQVLSVNRLARTILGFIFKKVKAHSAHFHYEIITPEIIYKFHRWEVPIYAWTVNDIDIMKHLIELGVDGIITNKPGQLYSILNGKPASEPKTKSQNPQLLVSEGKI